MGFRRCLIRAAALAALALGVLVMAPTATAAGDADLWLTRFEGSGLPEYNYRAYDGQIVYYIVDVTNRGPADATNVVLTQQLPPELEYLPALSDSRCSLAGQTVTCRLGTVTVWGQGQALVYTRARSAGTFTSTATVTSDETELYPVDNSAEASVTVLPAADIAVSLTDAPDPVRVGDAVTYTATVTNNGPDAATGTRLTVHWEPFGPIATLQSFSGSSNATCSQTFANYLACDVSSLATGETATLTFVLGYTGGKGTVDVYATAIADQWDPASNNEPVETTTVVRKRVKP